MQKYKIIVEYCGTNYHGWQKQRFGISIQGELEKAANKVFSQEVSIVGAGRTDAGVHAAGQVAHFCVDTKIPVERISNAFNAYLPDDIAVKKTEIVPMDFHARYSAKGKKYIYTIYNADTRSALFKDAAAYVPVKLDIDLMKKAAKAFVGTHDFAAFAATGFSAKTTVRTINSINVIPCGLYIIIEVEGTGFLYNQVRIMSGTLIQVGKGKIPPESIRDIIKSKKREMAGPTAPPEGLLLHNVIY